MFLNVPFDDEYEPLYVALVAGVTAFGGTPRAVLEIPPQRDRLTRLRAIISECDASIHDLSRVETSGQPPVPRFNMPFELGLAIGILGVDHNWFVFERVPYQLSRSLSDIAGYDGPIHHGTAEGILRAVADTMGTKGGQIGHADLLDVARDLQKVARNIKNEHDSLFKRAAFADLVFAAKKAVEDRVASKKRGAPGWLHRAKVRGSKKRARP